MARRQIDDDESELVEPRARQVRQRGSRWPFVLLVFLILIAAVLVVGDRVAARYATGRLHDQVQSELASHDITTGSTDVTIGGFPFLTQVASGTYQKITINMTDVRAQGARLPTLHVVAGNVHAAAKDLADGTAKVTADTVTGDGIIDWPSVATLVNDAKVGLTKVSFRAVGDKVQATGTATVLNQQIPLNATAGVRLQGSAVRINLSEARIEGLTLQPQIQQAVDNYIRNFTFTIKVPPLPFGLVVRDLHVESDGLSIAATAKDVPLGR